MNPLRIVLWIMLLLVSAPAVAETIVLQQGLNGSTTDTRIASAQATTNFGTEGTYALLAETSLAVLIRFPIFVSEGGPVPNGATITSATLSLYKFWGPDAVFKASRLLKDWNESQATWNVAATGTSWETAGARGASDVNSTADGQGSVPTATNVWLDIDVTAGVQAFASGTANYGWKVAYVSGGNISSAKEFISRDNSTPANATFKPKLTITYATDACASGSLRPYTDAPVNGFAVPGVFEVEHFNCGGAGVAYNDVTTPPGPNSGQTFRSAEGVQIIAVATGGLAVNQFDPGDYMKYTINVTTAGNYDLAILASSNWTSAGSFRIYLDNDTNDVTGAVSVPITGNWETYQWVDAKLNLPLTTGQHVLKLVSEAGYFRTDKIRLQTTSSPSSCGAPPLRPYTAVPAAGIAVPGTFQAEHFNCGGPEVAYHDVTNPPGPVAEQTLRTDEGVQITNVAGGGFAVNQFNASESMKYTINVAAADNYDLAILASSNWTSAGSFSIKIDNLDKTGTVTVPITGSWDTYQWTAGATNVPLTAGQHELTLISVAGFFRVDQLRVLASGTPPPTGDDCTRPGLDLCVRFEANPETQRQGIELASPACTAGQGNCNQVRTQSVGGATLTWFALNKGPFGACTEDCANDTGRLNLVAGGHDGSSAIKLTTQDNDSNVHGSPGFERSQINLTGSHNGVAGQEHWWSHAVFFPTGEFHSTSGNYDSNNFFQFHHTIACSQPNILMDVFNQPTGTATPKRVIRVVDHGIKPDGSCGLEQFSYRTFNSYVPGKCLHDDFKTGVWYQFVHHIVWSSNGTGTHEIWMREGTSGAVKKVLARSGISNLYPGDHTYLSFGNYHTNLPGQWNSVIHDRHRRSSLAGDAGFNAVAPPDFVRSNPDPVATCSNITSEQ